jgi:hypothetical protein
MTLTPELKQAIGLEKPKAASGIRIEPKGGMGVAIVNNALRYMNPTSARIYKLMDGTRTIQQIVDEQHRVFPQVPEEELFTDTVLSVREFQYCEMAARRTIQD